jgi:orotate phosphoribosyltransferase
VLIALDRQERGQGALSAAQEVSRNHGIPVTAIATLDDVVATLRGRSELHDRIAAIEEYRRQYGA